MLALIPGLPHARFCRTPALILAMAHNPQIQVQLFQRHCNVELVTLHPPAQLSLTEASNTRQVWASDQRCIAQFSDFKGCSRNIV